MKLSGRIILNVLHFMSVQENNVDVVFWVMASVHSVTQTEDTRNESSVPSAFLWKLLNCLPLVAGCGRTFQRLRGTDQSEELKL